MFDTSTTNRDAPRATRVLVDRVWPRGLSKGRARIDEWCKQIAPSSSFGSCMGTTPSR
jgi:uncharacterized protein YeaO (DUF488 family)